MTLQVPGRAMRRTARNASPGITIEALGDEGGRALGLPGSRGLEGASLTSRELATFRPSMGSMDQIINNSKDLIDARGRDLSYNDAQGINAIHLHRNSIIGAQYTLNMRPEWRVLNASPQWAREFQSVAEPRFALFAESPAKWIDSARRLTFSNMLRLWVGGFVYTGEALAVVDWIKEADRPYKTAIQAVAPARLSNPAGTIDSPLMRRGIELDPRGKPLAYNIRQAHPGDLQDARRFIWKRVPAQTPWGRAQVVFINDPLEPGQTRGISDMVAVLGDMKMTKNFKSITLANAITNASYAAAIESDLPAEVIATALGRSANGEDGLTDAIGNYMGGLMEYVEGANNLRMDGVMIPHLYPGSRLSFHSAGTPGGVGTDFQAALERGIAAGLGLNYEEFSRDFSKLSFSGGKLAIASTGRFMLARKAVVADAMANAIFALWLEEELNAGNVPPIKAGMSLAAMRKLWFNPLMKEAFCAADWIGASTTQVDPVKEETAAEMRLAAGLSTRKAEAALLGYDWEQIDEQQALERQSAVDKGLEYSYLKPTVGTQPVSDPGGTDDAPPAGGNNQ